MDLLVHLIRKNEINIYDIPIALVTEQYLQYLEWLEAMNVEYAAEFVVMASTLAQIKSRMLLPVHAEERGRGRPAPGRSSARCSSTSSSSRRPSSCPNGRCWGRTPSRRPVDTRELAAASDDDEVIKIGLFELIDAFQKILSGLPDEARIESHRRHHLGQGAHLADRRPAGGQGVAHLL
ncbi:MAG: segregation/condensation protein A [Desulfobacterales bacterium]|nr:segregation/condensation protein A [Desulfobacterales bacterium]